MARKQTQRPRLTERDYDIFNHLRRYRITTPEILHRHFFADSERNAVTKVTSRLVKHEYLRRHDLYTPRKYFTIGPKAARIVGISPKHAAPLGPEALAREFGTLEFCLGGATLRQRLLVREVNDLNPELLARHIRSSYYYLDKHQETLRLGFIRVDFGAELNHLIRKLHEDIDHRYEHQAFRQFIDEGRFLIALVVARDDRKEDVRAALRRSDWPVLFRIEVVSDLVHLIARINR